MGNANGTAALAVIHSSQQLLVPKFTPDTGKEWKGDRSELCNQRHCEGVKGDRSKLCNQKRLWDMPLQNRELLPLGKEIQVPV